MIILQFKLTNMAANQAILSASVRAINVRVVRLESTLLNRRMGKRLSWRGACSGFSKK